MQEQPTIQELFDKDPLKLSEPELDAIIEKLRSLRHTYNQTGAPAKVSKTKAPASGLDLDIQF